MIRNKWIRLLLFIISILILSIICPIVGLFKGAYTGLVNGLYYVRDFYTDCMEQFKCEFNIKGENEYD